MEGISTAPYAQVISLHYSNPYRKLHNYSVEVGEWGSSSSCNDIEQPYRMIPGDILVFTETKPDSIYDLKMLGGSLCFGLVTKVFGDDFGSTSGNGMSMQFTVRVCRELEVQDVMHKSFYVVFITNVTTSSRIWNALHLNRNFDVIQEVLCPKSKVRDVHFYFFCTFQMFVVTIL